MYHFKSIKKSIKNIPKVHKQVEGYLLPHNRHYINKYRYKLIILWIMKPNFRWPGGHGLKVERWSSRLCPPLCSSLGLIGPKGNWSDRLSGAFSNLLKQCSQYAQAITASIFQKLEAPDQVKDRRMMHSGLFSKYPCCRLHKVGGMDIIINLKPSDTTTPVYTLPFSRSKMRVCYVNPKTIQAVAYTGKRTELPVTSHVEGRGVNLKCPQVAAHLS